MGRVIIIIEVSSIIMPRKITTASIAMRMTRGGTGKPTINSAMPELASQQKPALASKNIKSQLAASNRALFIISLAVLSQKTGGTMLESRYPNSASQHKTSVSSTPAATGSCRFDL